MLISMGTQDETKRAKRLRLDDEVILASDELIPKTTAKIQKKIGTLVGLEGDILVLYCTRIEAAIADAVIDGILVPMPYSNGCGYTLSSKGLERQRELTVALKSGMFVLGPYNIPKTT